MGAMAVAGVLIWSKLRLATDIPRSAYAVPEQAEEAHDPDTEPVPGTDPARTGTGDDLIGPDRD